MDRKVEEEAEAIFRASPYHQLRRLRCEFRDGVLVLRGSVPSYHLKQLAQTIVQGLESVAKVDNQVEVN